MMNKRSLGLSIVLSTLTLNAVAAELIIYPKNDQSKEQQQQDEGACFVWAKNETGFDPLSIQSVPSAVVKTPPPKKQRGGAIKGAIAGAVIGEIIGDEGDDVRDGAKYGAAAGLIRQGRRNKMAAKKQAQAMAEAEKEIAKIEAETAERRDIYNRHYSACLEGRGYSVK